jgi:phosphoglycolate phosphatase
MIGDRRHDIEAAKANGVRSIGVSYGYGKKEELRVACADQIVDSVDALHQLLLAKAGLNPSTE